MCGRRYPPFDRHRNRDVGVRASLERDLSVFPCFAVAGTLRNLGLPMPHWFPAPILNGSPMSVGVTLFL